MYDSSILECKGPASVSIAPAIQSVLPCSFSLLLLLLASFPHGCQRARRRLAGDESESEDEKLEFADKKLQLTDDVIPEKKFRDPSMYASAGFSDVYLSAGDTESYHQQKPGVSRNLHHEMDLEKHRRTAGDLENDDNKNRKVEQLSPFCLDARSE